MTSLYAFIDWYETVHWVKKIRAKSEMRGKTLKSPLVQFSRLQGREALLNGFNEAILKHDAIDGELGGAATTTTPPEWSPTRLDVCVPEEERDEEKGY